jgi:hypothetical protein
VIKGDQMMLKDYKDFFLLEEWALLSVGYSWYLRTLNHLPFQNDHLSQNKVRWMKINA